MFDLTLAPYAIRVRLCSVTHAKLAGDRPESRPRFVSVRFQCSTLRWGRWEFLRLALRLPLPPLAHAPCFMPPVNVFFFFVGVVSWPARGRIALHRYAREHFTRVL